MRNLTESQKIKIAEIKNTELKIDDSVIFEEKYYNNFVAIVVGCEYGTKDTYMIGKRGKVEKL